MLPAERNSSAHRGVIVKLYVFRFFFWYCNFFYIEIKIIITAVNINRVRFHFRSLLVSEIKHYNVRVGCLTYTAVIPVWPLHDLVPPVILGFFVQDALVPCYVFFLRLKHFHCPRRRTQKPLQAPLSCDIQPDLSCVIAQHVPPATDWFPLSSFFAH